MKNFDITHIIDKGYYNSIGWHRKFTIFIYMTWIVACIASLVWNIYLEKLKTKEIAVSKAKAAFNIEAVFREWNSNHGGVYAPVSMSIKPNPYLSDKERDIKTPSGKALTLINPAYMIRQIHELQTKDTGIIGHLTSLNPLRPENAPDAWESDVLRSFEKGEKEVYEVTLVKGEQHLRFMHPLAVTEKCLKCHKNQGYKIGDIRGGISISIPLASSLSMYNRQIIKIILLHLLFLLMVLITVSFLNRNITQGIKKQTETEKELRENKERMELALQGGNLGMWDYEVNTGQVIIDNRWIINNGYPHDYTTLTIDSWMMFIHPDDQKRMKESMENYLAERMSIFECEYRIKTNSNEWSWVLGRGHITKKSPEGKAARISGTHLDITKRKKMEERLQNSEERLRSLIEITSDMIWEVDINGRYTFVSPKVKNLLGYEPDEVISKDVFYFMHKEDIETTQMFFKNKLKSITPFINYHKTHVHKNGMFIELESSGIPIHDMNGKAINYIGFNRDITERKKAEQALLQSEKTYRTLFEHAVPAIYFTLDGTITLFNKLGARYLNGRPEDFIGKNVYDMLPDKADEIRECVKKIITSNEGHICEDSIVLPSGEHWFIHNYQPVRDTKGEITAIQILSQDITGKKQVEKENEEIQIRLRQSRKMEALGTLAGGIAHDFNNILSPIIGFSEICLDIAENDTEIYENLNEIYTAAIHAKSLVKQILTFSRQDEKELKPIKSQLIIKETLKLVKGSAPKNVIINTDISDNCGMALADPTHIHQITMNLCTNAFQAMEELGGELNVSLKSVNIGRDELINLRLTPGPYLNLKVIDTGSGIEKSIIEKIYDPYFTTKNKRKGTGLGLSIVHGIVKSLNGEITVTSDYGKGTEFNVYLPELSRESSEPNIEIKEIPQKGSEHILLVDDEDQIVRMTRKTLTNLGYKITCRTNSIEAFEAFRSNPDKYDLILTDHVMPNMTGVELALEIKKIRKNIPVIICTGFSEQINKKQSDALGIDGFLLKPIIRSKLANAISKVLGKET